MKNQTKENKKIHKGVIIFTENLKFVELINLRIAIEKYYSFF